MSRIITFVRQKTTEFFNKPERSLVKRILFLELFDVS